MFALYAEFALDFFERWRHSVLAYVPSNDIEHALLFFGKHGKNRLNIRHVICMKYIWYFGKSSEFFKNRLIPFVNPYDHGSRETIPWEQKI